MATAGGSYQIFIRLSAHRASRRLRQLSGQLTALENQVNSMPTAVMDGTDKITAAGTKRIRARSTALQSYGKAMTSASVGAEALSKATKNLGPRMEAVNAATPGAVKTRQMREYASAMRSWGTAGTRGAEGAKAFRNATAGMDVRLERMSKALPEAAVGMELLGKAMKDSAIGWTTVNAGLDKAAPAMGAYAKATNAAAAAQERMNRASLGATKNRVANDKPAAAVTRTGNVVRRSTAVQSDAAAASAALTGAVRQNYEGLADSARSLAASTASLSAFGNNARLASSGVDALSKSNNKLATSILAVASAQKKLNTAYAGATGKAAQQKVATTQRVGNVVRAADNATTPVTVTTDVQGMYRNLEGTSKVADTAAPRVDRLATSMERYAAAAKLASNSTRNLARHLGTVAATAPGAAGAMNVATDSAAKTSLAAAAAAGAGNLATASAGAATEMDKADRVMGRWMNRARTHGATMNWAGRQISMFFTLPLALAGGAAIKWQMDNEKAMTQVAKVYDGRSEDIKNSLKSIEDGGPHFAGSKFDKFFTALSGVMGQSKADVANIAADWAAVGVQGEQLAAATQLTTEMMVLGDMGAEEATRSLIAVQAQYSLGLGNLNQELEALAAVEQGVATEQQKRIVQTESLADVMATLNAVENATGATMADLIRGFERTAAPARQLGIDAQTLAAHMATLVPAMGTAERAGNALKTIYQALAAPRTERQVGAMEKLATNAGLAGDAFLNSQFLAEGMGKGIEEIAKAYSHLQGADRFTWARDVFGVYQYARGIQMLEDVSRGLGVQTDEQAEHMRKLSEQYVALGNGAEEAAFIAEHFGIAIDDVSNEAVSARGEFDKLLRDAEKIQSLSFYRQAGKGSEEGLTSQARLELYQRELDTVLKSNPQRFKQAMEIIKNSMADFIIPILPLIIAITQEVAKLARWLGDLPASVQKLIAVVVLTIAVFGPLIALFGTFFIAMAMMGKAFDKLSGFLSIFRKDTAGAASDLGKVASLIGRLTGRRRRGGGGLFGGGGGDVPTPVPVIGGGGGASAWPRREAKEAERSMDRLGDEMRDLGRKGSPAARVVDAYTLAILRNMSAASKAAQAVGGASAAAAGAGGAAGGAAGGDKDRDAGRKAGATSFAGGLLGSLGIPGFGRLGRKKLVDDAKKTQAAVGAAEKKGMFARIGAMLGFNKQAGDVAAKGGRGILGKMGGPLRSIPKLFTGLFGSIGKLLPRLLGVVTGPWGLAATAVVTILQLMGVDIIGGVGKIFSGVKETVASIIGDDKVPFLAKPFVAAIGIIGKVLSNLPKIVADAVVGVLNILRKMAASVSEFFGSLNPFKRHSPSLVDNVTRGMEVIGGRFKDAGRRVSQVMRAARADVKAFGAATAGLSMNVENVRVAENREKVATHAPAAVPQFDALVGHQRVLTQALEELAPVIKEQEAVVESAQRAVDAYDRTIEKMNRSVELAERHLDKLNKRLSEAQENFDRYANAQILGLGAVEDAIFANEMAQKRLQLALKKAGADDMATTEEALSRIQGQMDDMAAKREALRLGGAGSEILSVYDQHLGGLAAERESKMTGPSTEIERMTKALEDLQAQAEIMDLEKSLKFDPLNRQLDKMRTKTEEMSFERIAAGMAVHGAQVDLYQGQVDRASAAIDRQREAITAVEDQRYLATQALEAEQLKLDEVTAAQDAMREVLDEVSQALDVAISDADEYTRHLDDMADAAERASEALDGVGGAGGADGLGDAFGDAADFDIPGGSFDPNEVLPSVEEMTDSLTNRIKEALEGVNLGDSLKGLGKKIWDGLLKALGSVVPSASYITGYVIGAVARIVEVLGEETVRALGEVADFTAAIVEWFKNADWAALKENITSGEWWGSIGQAIIDGIGSGLSAAWEGTKDFFDKYVVTPFMDGFKKGFGIASPATAMIPMGGYIIDGMLEGMRLKIIEAAEWLGSLPGIIATSIGDLWHVGVEKASQLWQGIADKWGEVVENVRAFGSDIWAKLKEGIGNLLQTARDWAQGFIDGIGEMWGTLTSEAWRLGQEIYNKIKEGIGDLLQLGRDSAGGLVRGLKEGAKGVWEEAKSLGRTVWEGAKEALDSHSPSRVMMAVGHDVAEGLVIGMNEGQTDIAAAAARMASAAIPDSASMASQAQAAAPTAQAGPVAPGTEGDQASPFAAIATDAQANLAQVEAIATTAANNTATGYLTTMGQMRMTDLTNQVAHATMFSATAANLTTATVGQATAMATGVTAQATSMAVNSTLQATNMATGVTSAGASMANGMLSAGASMEAGMASIMGRMAANISGVVNGQIAPVINSFDPLLQTMVGWFDAATNNVGAIWAGIQPRTADPARFVINEVYDVGLRGAWNSFNEFLGLDPLPSFRASFATGGPVRGPGTGTSDSIPARLSNGEHVITAREVKNAGGHDAVKAQRQVWASSRSAGRATYTSPADRHYALAAGGPVLAFARGGPVEGGEMPPMKGSEGGLNMNAVRAGRAVSLKFPQVSTIGGYRPSDPFPDHPSGNALDIMVGSFALGDAIHAWLWANNSKLFMASDIWKQTYYTSPTNGSLMEDRGDPTQNHMDHVHALFTPSPPHRPGMKYGGIPIGTPAIFAGAGSGGMSVDWGQVVGMTFDTELGAIRDRAPKFPGLIGQWVPKSIDKAFEAKDFLAKKLQEMTHYQGTIDDSMGAVERWRPMMKAALIRQGLAHWANDPAILDRFMRQIWTESKGNPTITQGIQDINSGGNEAEGLAQIAKGTWAQYHDPTLPNDWHDPWANLNTMARYVRGRYGPQGYLNIGNGIGYDAGGILPPTPGGWGTYYNHTGKPEVVLTNAQWRAIYRAASQTPGQIAGVAAAAAAAAVEKVTAIDSTWKAAILGEVEAISEATSTKTVDPWEGFNSTLSGISEFAQKAGNIADAVISAQEATQKALADADERVLGAAKAAAEASSAEADKVTAATDAVASEVTKVNADTTAIASAVGAVKEDVEEIAANTPQPELFTEALERLWGESNDLYTKAVSEATATIHSSINTGDLAGGIASLEAQVRRNGHEANLIAAETLKLLGENLDTVAAVVGAWKPVVDGVYELFKAIPDVEQRTNGPWMAYPGGPSTFMHNVEGTLNGIWNVGAELFNLTKNTLPALVKHGVGIGSTILDFAAENGDAIAALVGAVATGNPLMVLPFLPKLLSAGLKLLPMIIEAVQEIVPAMLRGIWDFIQSIFTFGNTAYSYKTMEDATRAIEENTDAIRKGTFVPGQESETLDRGQSGTMITFNGDLSFPNVTSAEDAKGFLSGVQSLSGRG